MKPILWFLCLAALPAAAQMRPGPHRNDLSPQRIAELRTQLPASAQGLGTPCSNRAAWTPLAPSLSASVEEATKLTQSPIPAWNEDDYLDYSRTGQRPRGEAMLHARQARLAPLVLAECATYQGTYLPAINAILDALASQPTWTLPAHDPDLSSLHHKQYRVELNSAGLSYELAETLYLLGDKLSPATQQHVHAALEERIFAPMRAMYRGDLTDFWLRGDSNWNAVCLAGATGAALTALSSPDDRALFAAGAEHFSANYLLSFSSDGYSQEGPGYWVYGFQHYALLRETLWHATQRKLDLFNDPRVESIALFGRRFQMLPGIMADFGDAHYGGLPNYNLISYVDRVYGLKGDPSIQPSLSHPNTALVTNILALFPNASTRTAAPLSEDPLRHFFATAGVLVSRPQPGSNLAITLKDGGNGGHSHNDIGSFSVALGDQQVIADPGGPAAYTADTFTSKRFNSRLLNSYGHPVPTINGALQLEATTIKPVILSTSFTPQQDTIAIDMTKAYVAPNLHQLTRTMSYQRQGNDRIVIEDHFDITAPTDIEESLPTHGTYKQIDGKTLLFTTATETLRVSIDAPASITVHPEKIDEYGNPFLRVGLSLHMQQSGSIKMTFTPEAPKP